MAKIYQLQKNDCSPAHFAWSEVDGGCGAGGYNGGSVSATTVKANLLRAMWRAEALRHLPMPVIGRIADERLLLDMRCLEDASL